MQHKLSLHFERLFFHEEHRSLDDQTFSRKDGSNVFPCKQALSSVFRLFDLPHAHLFTNLTLQTAHRHAKRLKGDANSDFRADHEADSATIVVIHIGVYTEALTHTTYAVFRR
jgi:hypothetical protein